MEKLVFRHLSSDTWDDFETLFGTRGACGGCWCMWWRLKRSQYEREKGDKNRARMKSLVDSGEIPGIIGYAGDEPVAWCSVAPRETYPVLDRSRVLGRVDEEPVWSIVCFFVAKQFRNRGLSRRILEAAVDFVRERGGRVVEGYPVEPKKNEIPDLFAATGLASAFVKAGFAEVARRSDTRPIMRKKIGRRKKPGRNKRDAFRGLVVRGPARFLSNGPGGGLKAAL